MLIVNADDWGRSKAATDRAIVCYQHGRISSTTAMVFMEDSVRAAELARNIGIDVGLHLNLSEEFTQPSVPTMLRDTHVKVCRFLRMGKYALILYNPILRRQFALVFRAQVEEFSRLYGKTPSHIDGHQHMHLCSNILLDGIIPRGTKLRRSFSFGPGQKSVIQRTYRKFVNSYIARRYRLTHSFFALAHHLPIKRLLPVVELAADHSVEVMAHPQLTKDYECLMSDEYAAMISGVRLGSYSSL